MKKRIRGISTRVGDWLSVQRVGVILLALSLITGISGYMNQHPEGFDAGLFLSDFYANASTELASIAITVLLIDSLNRRRESRLEESREREQLIRKLGSKVNVAAREAAEDLRAKGWLGDGTLQHADLRAANLEDADFYQADLQGVNFEWAALVNANLRKANMVGANLSHTKAWGARCYKADMRGVNFTNAKMYRIDFTKADLHDADFTGAVIEGANLTEANLRGANLTGAVFMTERAKPDTVTILPDGTHWAADCDLARFTDPTHVDFWQPHTDDEAARIDVGDE
jgi:uncharacterized protein YjbI with pentapeptide repeats